MSRTTRPLRWTRLAAIPLAVGVLAACSPIETNRAYAPSDGIDVTLSDGVRGINLLVVSAADGEPGRLLGAFTNQTDEDATVTVALADGRPRQIPVDAGQTVNLAENDAANTEFSRIDAPPGGLVTVSLQTTSVGQTVEIPVLDGTLAEYAPYVPEVGITN